MNSVIESEPLSQRVGIGGRVKKSTLVILSGGMDSTVLTYYISNSDAYSLAGCISIDYGQRHAKELACAIETVRHLHTQHYYLDLSNLRDVLDASALTSDRPVPEGHYEEDSMQATVVPNRNMILLALAGGVAISKGAKAIAYGAHSGDHAIYPDCRPSFREAMRTAFQLCHYENVELLTPFIYRTKAELVKHGMQLGVNFKKTWSCYKGGDIACGRCGTCVERLEAFYRAGFEDPLEYADRDFWKTVAPQNP